MVNWNYTGQFLPWLIHISQMQISTLFPPSTGAILLIAEANLYVKFQPVWVSQCLIHSVTYPSPFFPPSYVHILDLSTSTFSPPLITDIK